MHVCYFKFRSTTRADIVGVVMVKKYTEDHEWIEMDADGKIGQ